MEKNKILYIDSNNLHCIRKNTCACMHVQVCEYECVCVCVYVRMCVCAYLYAGLKIGGVASQNASHFWSNCDSLRQSDLQYSKSLLGDCESFFAKVTLFR